MLHGTAASGENAHRGLPTCGYICCTASSSVGKAGTRASAPADGEELAHPGPHAGQHQPPPVPGQFRGGLGDRVQARRVEPVEATEVEEDVTGRPDRPRRPPRARR